MSIISLNAAFDLVVAVALLITAGKAATRFLALINAATHNSLRYESLYMLPARENFNPSST
jgi:hypothetical protein